MDSITDEELAPCPFCGKKARWGTEDGVNSTNVIYCNNCDTEFTFYFTSERELPGGYRNHWNTRTPSLDSIIRRAVELAREEGEPDLEAGRYGISMRTEKYQIYEIIEQIKKEMVEI